MKRLLLFFSLVAILLTGCTSEIPSLENTTWTFTTLQDQEGRVTACAEALADIYPEADVLSVTCRFDEGRTQVTFGHVNWSGSYRPINVQGTIFEVTFDDGDIGYLNIGLISSEGATPKGTLYLTKGYDTWNFQAN